MDWKKIARRNLVVFAYVLVTLSGCALLKQKTALQRCTFEWMGMKHVRSSVTQSRFDLEFLVFNPNDIGVSLTRIDITLYADDLELGTASSQSGLRIPANGTAPLAFSVEVSHFDAAIGIKRVLAGQVKQFRLLARIRMNTPFGIMTFEKTLWRKGA